VRPLRAVRTSIDTKVFEVGDVVRITSTLAPAWDVASGTRIPSMMFEVFTGRCARVTFVEWTECVEFDPKLRCDVRHRGVRSVTIALLGQPTTTTISACPDAPWLSSSAIDKLIIEPHAIERLSAVESLAALA
jgi:hypothetical protein